MGLLPLTQSALYIIPRLSYHDYEGVALHKDERERLQADLGETSIMLLRNHGTLALGSTPAEAWRGIYGLEKACSAQVAALAAGRDNVLIAPEAAPGRGAATVGRPKRHGHRARYPQNARSTGVGSGVAQSAKKPARI
jgi:ribulose-5-phosphate 4-epimerase/fuculose-1-phosphate aldolase